jgi:hypothetical protein
MRTKLAFAGVSLMLLSVLAGGLSFTHAATPYDDLAKIVSVALFVGAMIAFAVGMIGDTRRHRRS